MKTLHKNKSAFTLLELLVTLFIIAVIISMSVIVYDVSWSKSRNSKRVSDIIRIQNALETYHKQEGKYPDSLNFGGDLMDAASSTVYMLGIPQNPSPRDDGDCANQDYIYSTSTDLYGNDTFYIQFCIGNKADRIEKGINCATNQGITTGACPNNNLKSGLNLWLKADGSVINRFSSSTAYVSTWNDESGNNNNVTQSDINKQPTIVTSTVNNKPGIRFDGVDDFLNGGDILDMNTGDFTMFVVGKNNAPNGSFISKSLYGGAANRYSLLSDGGSLIYLYQDNAHMHGITIAHTVGSYEIMSTERDNILGQNRLYANNILLGTNSLDSWNIDSDFNFLVGSYNNVSGGVPPIAGYYLNGDINEILIYNRLLNASEKNEIYTYFQDKYGL